MERYKSINVRDAIFKSSEYKLGLNDQMKARMKPKKIATFLFHEAESILRSW
jgi:hypothetical protein